MRMLQSILFATDFRPASQDAIHVVAPLVTAFGSRVSVIHVLESSSQDAAAHLFHRQLGDQLLQGTLQRFAEHELAVAKSWMKSGPVADTILHAAQDMDADLIVMGAGELSTQGTFGVGPVAQAVMEQAVQPVLSVRPSSSSVTWKTILCPLDHSEVSYRGLGNGIRLAKVLGSKLIVLSVIPDVNWLTAAVEAGGITDVRAAHEQHWRDEFETFLDGVDFEGISHAREVRAGIPHVQIVAAAREHQADLLIMGATGRTALARMLLGSTTRRVLRALPCSLLTVKQQDVVQALFEADLRTIELLLAEARALRGAGSRELAASKLRQILMRDPFHVEAVECLAVLEDELGHPHEAKTYHRRASQLRQPGQV